MLKILTRICLFLCLSFIFLYSFSSKTLAQQEFDTRFVSSYTVSNEGIATVSHIIELTNKLKDVYADEYSLSIGSTRVKNIQASSQNGSINTTIAANDNGTQIQVKFSEPVIGKDKTLRFEISYINLDIATKNGRVLEVNIPRLENANQIQDYTLLVMVPDMFDNPTLMSPPASAITRQNNYQVLRYNKPQITKKGISILFGNHQVYDFTFRYSLKNPSLTPISTTVALPPDTPYQKLYYQSISPQPKNVTLDTDGNWLALYYLEPDQTTEITAVGQAILYLKPTADSEDLKPNNPYLSQKKYWPVNDPEIISLAQKLKTPENIYNYLVDNLNYNYDRIDAGTTRLGASAALKDPQNAICTEFTDLFIALSRAAGIPARSHDGFAFTTNSRLRPLSLKLDVLHSWPEYFNQETSFWIPVDPTWGNTTQGIDYFSRWDLNHFTFVIHGEDSSKPYPVGAYKLSSTNGKDVNVAFSNDEPKYITDLKTTSQDKQSLFPIPTTELTITVKNQGNTAEKNIPIKVSAPGYNIDKPETQIKLLPPFGQQDIKVKISSKFFKIPNNINYSVNQNSYTHEVKRSSQPSAQITRYIATLAVASIAAFIAYRAGNLLVSKLKPKSSLRRQSKKPKIKN